MTEYNSFPRRLILSMKWQPFPVPLSPQIIPLQQRTIADSSIRRRGSVFRAHRQHRRRLGSLRDMFSIEYCADTLAQELECRL